MRLSCNGCRILRKGCSEDCCIRPCLEWIKTPEAQSNATLFLAKFYGRAGLVNLINAAASPNLRPAVFKSLLYEACGRIVNPVQGSAGLLWSGKWNICESAVEAALAGKPITPIPTSPTESTTMTVLPAKASDIRHVSKSKGSSPQPQSVDLLPRHSHSHNHNHNQKALKPAGRGFKRAGSVKGKLEPAAEVETESGGSSRDGSGVSQTLSKGTTNVGVGDGTYEDVVSAETLEPAEAEARLMRLAELAEEEECEVDVGLELTLGHGGGPSSVHKGSSGSGVDGGSGEAGGLALGLGVVCK